MKYNLVKKAVDLVEEFELCNTDNNYSDNISGFKKWIADNCEHSFGSKTAEWEGKEFGRSAESVISTLLVHMNRFAKNYSKAAILGSEFSTQEDFIYLITLKAFGEMTKMDLIKKNVHEKPAGILIINRLMQKGWVVQKDSEIDKRSKIINITTEGLLVLDQQMEKIRMATTLVSGNLSEPEKMELIKLLTKLNEFHVSIYHKNTDLEKLLDEANFYKKQTV